MVENLTANDWLALAVISQGGEVIITKDDVAAWEEGNVVAIQIDDKEIKLVITKEEDIYGYTED